MTWKTLYFGFDGRISRMQWWLAMASVTLVSLSLSVLVNPQGYFESAAGTGSQTADTLLSLAFLIPETAISVKRFNDRNWPQWLPYGFALAVGAFEVMMHFGLLFARHHPSTTDLLIFSALVTALLAIVVDNGFLRGTAGPNQYGPDPLGAPDSGVGEPS